nr:reverse transcriptase domain-containing protein [Tanacetum cinerariifolium]
MMNYEDGLTDVAAIMKWFQSEWKESLMQLQSKFKERLTQFQFKVVEHITQARQEISLLSDKFYTSIEAAVINKKNQKWQVHSFGVQPNQRGHKSRMKARLFWKKSIFNDESKDKDLKVNTSSEALLILKKRNFLSISSDQEPLFHLELSVTETLHLGILTSKGVHSLTLELSHQTYETFKIVNIHLNILNEGEYTLHQENYTLQRQAKYMLLCRRVIHVQRRRTICFCKGEQYHGKLGGLLILFVELGLHRELSSLFDFEEVMNNNHNQEPPPAGPPPQNNNGPPPMVRPNGQAPHSMEELCQPSINGQGGRIAPIPIQATDFGLRHHMIQQVQNTCQFHGLPGDDANRHIDKFLEITQHMKQNGVSDDALRLSLFHIP